MNTLNVYKTRKDEIIDATMAVIGQALSGDRANRTFYFTVNDETNELTVDYLYYLGQVQLDDNCFYTIPDNETPDPEEFGFHSIEEMDFEACGYRDFIESAIDNTIEQIEANN